MKNLKMVEVLYLTLKMALKRAMILANRAKRKTLIKRKVFKIFRSLLTR